MRAAFVLLLVLCAAVAAAPAHAATGDLSCRLPGYVTGPHSAPCPAADAHPVHAQFLGPVGHIFGSIVGFSINAMMQAVAGVALRSAAAAVRITGSLLTFATRPALGSTWFSAAYWRVAAVSTLLTLPFLFAAGVHALVRSDLTLVLRAAFGYLPLALLGVSIAAPLTMLLLGATDEMSSFVAGAAGGSDASFLARAAAGLTTPSLIHGDLLIGFVVAMLTILAAVALWIELLIRGAAVDVIVLLLPLFFAAMVWPARRVWAIRAIETLIALILSKFAIVAVLTLGGAALSHLNAGPAALLTGATLILLAALTPWALLRLLPLHELASAAAGGLSQTPRGAVIAAASHAMPGRGQKTRDGDPAGEPSVGDDPDQALRRLLAASPPGGVAPGRGSAIDLGDLAVSPVTRAGLQAVENAGGRPSPPPPGVALMTPLGDGPRSARGPLPEPFGPEPWKGFVLGDGGNERMAPPRFADPQEGPGSAADDEPSHPAPPAEPMPEVTPPPPVPPPGAERRDPSTPPEPPAGDEEPS